MIRRSPKEKSIIIMRHFLHTLFKAYKKARDSSWKKWEFNETEPADESIRGLLDAPADCLFYALRAVLIGEENQGLVVVDGFDKVNSGDGKFAERVIVLVDDLQQYLPKVKILLTGRSMGKHELISGGLSSIYFDRERQDCLHSLHFKDNRFVKISEEYQDTCEWLWEHQEYKKWSTSQSSHLLLIQGKPGSGKSTITKYFHNNLLQREPNANRAIVAKFFYSHRDGELQKSHTQMLRSILYDILDQDEHFFYHKCQSKYRELCNRRADWDFDSLKELFKSLYDHASSEQLYLIIDAVDESENHERQEVLYLLFQLCDERKDTITRVFIASRPVDGPLLKNQRECQSVITLQNETKSDIEKLANSFLMELYRTDILKKALNYIIKHAEGVFLWVKLVGQQLAMYSSFSEIKIFEYLESLPTELEAFYIHMLKEMDYKGHLRDGLKMLRFVLFSRRPLRVSELLHAVAMPDDPRIKLGHLTDSFQKHIPSREFIHSCGCNFLEIKLVCGLETVQIMHQTVSEFFLRSNGSVTHSIFRMSESEANISISLTCIRYLMLCAANSILAGGSAEGNYRSRIQKQAASLLSWKKSSDSDFWEPKKIEGFAQCLDERPLAHYALQHLQDHIDYCHGDENIEDITNQFLSEMKQNPAACVLKNWNRSRSNNRGLSEKKAVAIHKLRNKILDSASRKGFSNTVGILLASGADVHMTDPDGWTILHRAADQGQEAVAGVILLYGKADINAADKCGNTALQCAVERGSKTMVRLLVDGKADLETKNYEGNTALHCAVKRGDEVVMRMLVEGKADLDTKDKTENTALHLAVQRQDEAMVSLLVSGKAYLNLIDGDENTALHLAVEKRNMTIATMLVVKGKAKVNSRDKLGLTALHKAVKQGHEDMARFLLLEGKANVNVTDKLERTALHWAVEQGHEAVARLLVVEGKADVDITDFKSQTALHRAAEQGHEAMARLLLREGKANVNAKATDGLTALHLIAKIAPGRLMKQHEDTAKVLIEEGKADVNAKGWEDWTPLHSAARLGHETIVRLLLGTEEIDIHAKENGEWTALQWATERGNEAVARLLMAHQARQRP